MIVNELFPDNLSWDYAQFSDLIVNGNLVTDESFNKAYWLGWVKEENLAPEFQLSKFTYSRQGVKFTRVSEGNHDYGMLAIPNTSASGVYTSSKMLAYKEDKGKWDVINNTATTLASGYDYRFINNANNFISASRIRIILNFNIITASGSYTDQKFLDLSYDDLVSFLNGEYIYHYIYTQQGVDFNLDTSVFKENYLYENDLGDKKVSCYLGCQTLCERDYDSTGRLRNYSNIVPMVHTEAEGMECVIAGSSYYPSGTSHTSYGLIRMNVNFSNYTVTLAFPSWYETPYYYNQYNNYYIFAYGFDSEMTFDELNSMVGYNIKAFGNAIVRSTSGTTARTYYIERGFKIDDIKKTIAMQNRCRTSTTTGNYGMGNYFFSTVTGDGEITPVLLTGTDIYDKLADWQKDAGYQSSEYTEEEKPRPKPEEGDEGDIYGGDVSRAGNTNYFMSYYALTPYHVNNLGQHIWGANADVFETVMNSFYIRKGTDYAVSMGDLSQYFSIKAYPFDIRSVFDCTARTDNGIYVGTGSHILSVGDMQQPYNINRTTAKLYGGSVTIPYFYNNFMDLEPYTTVTLEIPYCGEIQVTPSQVMGATLEAEYTIDLVSGNVLCTIFKTGSTHFPVGFSHGKIGFEIPLSGNNATALAAKNAISRFKTATNAISQLGGTQYNGTSPTGIIDSAYSMSSNIASASVMYGINTAINEGVMFPLTNQLSAYCTEKGEDASSMGSPQTIYARVTRKHIDNPEGYGHTFGNVFSTTTKLENLNGLTICANVDVSSIPCTIKEQSEIKKFLESGVFV